ncbi:MAG: glycosyltransferase family 2 protein [Leptolyngbyaceae cyanobacterium]
MTSPLISLVTTIYNRQQYLAQTVDSILAQTYSHFELILWDDGSNDDSADLAQTYAQQDNRIGWSIFTLLSDHFHDSHPHHCHRAGQGDLAYPAAS